MVYLDFIYTHSHYYVLQMLYIMAEAVIIIAHIGAFTLYTEPYSIL